MKWPCPIHNTGDRAVLNFSQSGAAGWMVGTTTKRRVCSASFGSEDSENRKDLVKFGLICLYLEVLEGCYFFKKKVQFKGCPVEVT